MGPIPRLIHVILHRNTRGTRDTDRVYGQQEIDSTQPPTSASSPYHKFLPGVKIQAQRPRCRAQRDFSHRSRFDDRAASRRKNSLSRLRFRYTIKLPRRPGLQNKRASPPPRRVKSRRTRVKVSWDGKSMPSISMTAIPLRSRAMSCVTRVAGRTIESRAVGTGAFDNGSSCSHIYYPRGPTGTNEVLIIRVGARSIQAASSSHRSAIRGLPAAPTPLIHRPALSQKSGVAPDAKDFLRRRKETGFLRPFFLLLPASVNHF